MSLFLDETGFVTLDKLRSCRDYEKEQQRAKINRVLSIGQYNSHPPGEKYFNLMWYLFDYSVASVWLKPLSLNHWPITSGINHSAATNFFQLFATFLIISYFDYCMSQICWYDSVNIMTPHVGDCSRTLEIIPMHFLIAYLLLWWFRSSRPKLSALIVLVLAYFKVWVPMLRSINNGSAVAKFWTTFRRSICALN